jgi:SulP family sulfate permease
MRDVLALDASGLAALEDLWEKLQAHHKALILCGPHSQPLFALTRAGYFDKIGMENVCGDMDAALARARVILEAGKKTD